MLSNIVLLQLCQRKCVLLDVVVQHVGEGFFCHTRNWLNKIYI